MLAISALNNLLEGTPRKISSLDSDHSEENISSSLGGILSPIFGEKGFFNETLNSLSHVHIIADGENSASKGNRAASSFQSLADRAITFFYFDFSASWPRTPSWISLLGSDTFYSLYARFFKRLIQECGTSVFHALHSTLEEFSSAKERSKQCVAAEAMAGILHSDIEGLSEIWDSWMLIQLQKIMVAPSVESKPEWAACIRYAVTGKGKYGTQIPVLRQSIFECLARPLPQGMATSVVTKRNTFLSVALIEISPPRMPTLEVQYHDNLLEELLDNMSHSSAQVREAIGCVLSVLCSNLRLFASFGLEHSEGDSMVESQREHWAALLTEQVSEVAISIQSENHLENIEGMPDTIHENGHANIEAQADVKRMETLFHFVISCLRSGRSSYLLDITVQLLYPVISLQETSNKDLSTLAKVAFELLKCNSSS